MGGDFAGMAEEFGEIIEGVRLIELAGVDQAHEHVADAGPILRAIEKRILAMADRFFQSPLQMLLSSGAPALCRKSVSFSQCLSR